MPELSGGDLLREWKRLMDAVVSSATSIAGRADVPRQLLEPMQRQLEIVQEIIERERRIQREVTGLVVAPVEAVLDLLEGSGEAMRKQAEALGAAGAALEETAALMATQAELFERTIDALRQPTELARAAAGLERRGRAQRGPRGGATQRGGRGAA